MYRGLTPSLLTLGVSNFIFYFMFNAVRELLRNLRRKKGSSSRNRPDSMTLETVDNLLASAIAGILNVLATNPLWLVAIRIKQGQHKKKKQDTCEEESETAETESCGVTGFLGLLCTIQRDEGVLSLWKGVAPSLMLVSNPIIQFSVYEGIKALLIRKQTRTGSNRVKPSTSLSPSEAFILGALAKAVATCSTYPVQVAQSKLRASSSTDSERNMNTATCLVDLWQRGGVGACYEGIEAKMTQTVLSAAFVFAFYEKILTSMNLFLGDV